LFLFLFLFSLLFFLVALTVPHGPSLLNGFLPFIPIPRCFPQIRNASLLNICPNTVPLSRPWPSFSSYSCRSNVENLLGFSGIIHPNNVTNPIPSSHSYKGDNVHVFLQTV
jgi:hypothetical protein